MDKATPSRSAFQAVGKTYRQKGIARRARRITISAIKEMPVLAAAIGGCASLGQGIPSFATPPHIVEAVCEALRTDSRSGKYSLGPGLPELRQAVAEDLQPKIGRPVDPDREICITVGAMEGLLAALLTVVDTGDEVIMPSPNYASHIEQVLLAEGIPRFVPLAEDGWRLDVEGIRRAVTPKTRAVIICSPHNPTGAVFSESELRAVGDLALEHDLFVISDETYDFLIYDGRPHFSLTAVQELKDHVIAAYSFSKKYAMTGWRVGFVFAPESILDHLEKIHDAGAICAPTVSQFAALAALKAPQDCVAEIRTALQARRDLACERLERLAEWFSFVRPQGAYYLMARSRMAGMDSMTLALRLLREARVITIPGAAFGPTGENHIRISFGGDPGEIGEAFNRIERWLSTEYRHSA